MTFISQANERELVSRAQEGDRNAYSELVRAHSQGVLNVIYRMCGNMQIAEDAAQETFIQAWLRLPSYRPQASLRNWLYRIATNTAIDMLRKEKRILPGELEDLNLRDAKPDPEVMTTNSEQTEMVQEAVMALPDASRAVLVMREFEDLSYKEISESLEIPVGTVMSRLNYARKLLRKKLEVKLYAYAEAENV